jgi:hypothetical protein
MVAQGRQGFQDRFAQAFQATVGGKTTARQARLAPANFRLDLGGVLELYPSAIEHRGRSEILK